jgi:peptidyl-tRNA hydrolase
MRIKTIYRKNLKMTPEKMASQVAHAVKGLGITDKGCAIIVLGVSDKKFNELVAANECYVQVDRGLTQVPAGTQTSAAWIEVQAEPECPIDFI